MKSHAALLFILCLAFAGCAACRTPMPTHASASAITTPPASATQTRATVQPVANTGELVRVRRNGQYGYADRAGTLVIAPQYEEAGQFSEGLAWVKVGDRYGYIDETGKLVIPAKFGEDDSLFTTPATCSFSEGLAAVRVDNAYGFIDTHGKFIVQPKYTDAQSFSEGLAAVQIAGVDHYRYGYIDRTGKQVIEPQFWEADPFISGCARVHLGGRTFHIDKTGDAILYIDKEAAREGDLVLVERDSQYGYADRAGTLVIAPQYEDAGMFAEGLAPVKIGDSYGYIDRAGRQVIAPRFDQADPFVNGRARVRLDGERSYINKAGQVIPK